MGSQNLTLTSVELDTRIEGGTLVSVELDTREGRDVSSLASSWKLMSVGVDSCGWVPSAGERVPSVQTSFWGPFLLFFRFRDLMIYPPFFGEEYIIFFLFSEKLEHDQILALRSRETILN